jgi:hypothetical protein
MPKMLVSSIISMTNNNELRTMNYLKRTQTNPILPALGAGRIALSAVEGPVASLSNPPVVSNVEPSCKPCPPLVDSKDKQGRQQGVGYFYLTKSGGKCRNSLCNQQGWVISLFLSLRSQPCFFMIIITVEKSRYVW